MMLVVKNDRTKVRGSVLTALALAVGLTGAGNVSALEGEIASEGEAGASQIASYSCREPKDAAASRVGQDTILTLTRTTNTVGDWCACVFVSPNGAGVNGPITRGIDLGQTDLDSINVCALLEYLGTSGSSFGNIRVATFDTPCASIPGTSAFNGSVYGWTTEVAYHGRKANPVNPYSAKVVGVAKDSLRIGPRDLDFRWTTDLTLCRTSMPKSVFVDDTLE